MTIKQIQLLLAYLGYYKDPVDGIWGDNSAKACRAFQQDFGGIGVDGIPGVETQKALKHAVAFGMADKPDQPPKDEEALFWESVPNFEKVEFTCHCGCGLNNVDHDLVRACQRLRDQFGAAFIISSPCRCEANNRKAGGVWNSKHLSGRAVDFCIRGYPASKVLPAAQAQPEIRYAYAIDGSFVHMEMA